MSVQNLSAKNPYYNASKTTQQKKPLKNPFSNIKQDDDFQSLNFSVGSENQNTGIHSPFDAKVQDEQKAFFGQPIQTDNRKQQPFGNSRDNFGGVGRSNSANLSSDPRRDQGQRNADTSNMSRVQNNQMSAGANQQPLYTNSLLSSLSTINNYFGGQPPKENQTTEVYDEDNEPPLLEDLGIDLQLIKMRTLAVLKFQELDERFVKDADMSGPLLIALAFGSLLLLHGKIHFGYIYGFGVVGTFGIYFIMNLLSQVSKAQLYNTMSILGYCLMPLVILSSFGVILDLVSWYGFILCAGSIIWATVAATRFFALLLNLDHQKLLVAYPVFLFYLVFVLITIF